jgi:hypothetical protein
MTAETSSDARGSDEQMTLCPFTTIPTGTPLQIEKGAAGKRRRGTSSVLGTRGGSHIFIEMPTDGTAPLFSTHTKEKVVVRFFMQGNVFGFSTRISAVNFHPFAFAICDFPKHVQKLSVRHHKRLRCSLPATVKLLPPADTSSVPRCEITEEEIFNTPLAATIIDLAEGGCRLAIPILPTDIQQQELKFRRELDEKAENKQKENSENAEDESKKEENKHDDDEQEEKEPELSPLQEWAAKRNIKLEHISLYKSGILNERLFSGRGAIPSIELPFPVGKIIENTATEIRWNNAREQHLDVGMKFAKMPDEAKTLIDNFLAFVQKYFASNITAG